MGRSVRRSLHHPPPFAWCYSGAPSPFTVRAIESEGELDRLEPTWSKLLPPTAPPFATFAWNRAWYRHFADAYDRPLVLEVSRAGAPVAILPCYREGRRIRLAGDVICDYQDIVAPDEVSAIAGLRAAFRWMERETPGSRFFFLKLSSEGWLHRLVARRRALPVDALSFLKRYAPCPVVDIAGGLDAYLASRPRRVRQDFRRALKRLDREAPRARVEIDRGLGIRVDDFHRAADFHVEHFRRSGVSPLADERLRGLLAEVSKAPEVGLHLSVLRDIDELLAVDFGFVRAGRYYGYLTAFDPVHRRLAPGKCLLLRRIDEWVKEDGVEVLDFLAGDERYKTEFTDGEGYAVHSAHLMPAGLAHRLRRSTLVADRQLRTAAKLALAKLGTVET